MIDLTPHAEDIEQVARRWQKVNRRAGVKDRRMSSGDIDKLGAAGEAAVAIALGMYSSWRSGAVRRKPQSQKPDVGPVHVRATSFGRRLLIKPHDVDGAYALAWIKWPQAKVVGWRFGFECRRREFYRTDLAKPLFLVPADRLYDLESLKHWIAYKMGAGGDDSTRRTDRRPA